MITSKSRFEKLTVSPQKITWKPYRETYFTELKVSYDSSCFFGAIYFKNTQLLRAQGWHAALKEENLPKIMGEVIWALPDREKVWCEK